MRVCPLEEHVDAATVDPRRPLATALTALGRARKWYRFWSRKARAEFARAQVELVRTMLRIMMHWQADHPGAVGHVLSLVFFSRFLSRQPGLAPVRIAGFVPSRVMADHQLDLEDYLAHGWGSPASPDFFVPEVLTWPGCESTLGPLLAMLEGTPFEIDPVWHEHYRRRLARMQLLLRARRG